MASCYLQPVDGGPCRRPVADAAVADAASAGDLVNAATSHIGGTKVRIALLTT